MEWIYDVAFAVLISLMHLLDDRYDYCLLFYKGADIDGFSTHIDL